VSYCRKVSSKWLSNDKAKWKGNKKNGNKYLAWAYSEAAEGARRCYTQARTYYSRKMQKTNFMCAHDALAHKLARAAYYVMRDDVVFQPEKIFSWVIIDNKMAGGGNQVQCWKNQKYWVVNRSTQNYSVISIVTARAMNHLEAGKKTTSIDIIPYGHGKEPKIFWSPLRGERVMLRVAHHQGDLNPDGEAGIVATDTQTEWNYGNGTDVDDWKDIDAKLSFSRHGVGFSRRLVLQLKLAKFPWFVYDIQLIQQIVFVIALMVSASRKKVKEMKKIMHEG